MAYGRLSFSDLAPVWRILVAIAVCQIVGGIIGVAYGYHHFWFKNLWAGGVLATPFGLILGFIWHFSRTKDRRRSVRTAGVIGLIGALLLIFAIAIELPGMVSEMRNLETLARLPQEAVRRIEVSGRYGEPEIVTLTDPAVVAAFTTAIADGIGHSPSHPRYTHSWRVVAVGPVRHEFDLHLDPAFPDSVIGYFIKTSENRTSYQGSFRSVSLRRWVEQHLQKEGTAG